MRELLNDVILGRCDHSASQFVLTESERNIVRNVPATLPRRPRAHGADLDKDKPVLGELPQ